MIKTVAAARPRTGRLAIASIVGTTLEYYDFAVYNTLAALVFGRLFFPSFDPLSGTLLASPRMQSVTYRGRSADCCSVTWEIVSAAGLYSLRLCCRWA